MNTSSQSTSGSALNEREGKVAKAIEHQTAKLPSDLFLWAAGASILGSVTLQLLAPKPTFLRPASRFGQVGNFVGQWAPTFLLLGIYNKIVKVAGSDRTEQTRSARYGS